MKKILYKLYVQQHTLTITPKIVKMKIFPFFVSDAITDMMHRIV